MTTPGYPKMEVGQTVIPDISVAPPDSGQAYSFATWRNQAEGIYIVEVEVDGSGVQENRINNNAATRAILVGQLDPGYGAVTGHLTDPVGGVSGVTVYLLDATGRLLDSGMTHERGGYLFADVPVGEVSVAIDLPAGYVVDASSRAAAVLENEITEVDFFLSPQHEPKAQAGGPYTAIEGNPLTLDASNSTDPDGDSLQYRWDYNDDGVWDTTWQNTASTTHTWPDDWQGTVRVEVSDELYSSVDTAVVSVENSSPVVDAGSDLFASAGVGVNFNGSYTDVSQDTHTVSWEFGDGSSISGTLTPSHTYTQIGVYTVALTVLDDDGGNGSDNLVVSVEDTTPPTPAIDPLPTATGQCVVNLTPPVAADDCAGVITATTTDPVTYDVQGTYTVNWTYDDGNGNVTSQTQTVIVEDTEGPLPNVTSLTDAVGECSLMLDTPPVATDNCGGTITATTSDPLTYTTLGSYTVTWVYDDGNGNVIEQLQTVQVVDTEAPMPNLAFLPDAEGQCSVELVAPLAVDNCQGPVIATTSDQLIYTEQGSYMVTWLYADAVGNLTTQIQTVIVEDTEAPVPLSDVLADAEGQCSLALSAPQASDNCSGAVTASTEDPVVYDQQGTYLVTWTYEDAEGNSTSQTQAVVLDDTEAPMPVVDPLPNVVGQCEIFLDPPVATDNCTEPLTATTEDPVTYTNAGSHLVTWIFDDGYGNIAIQEMTVVVENAPPNGAVLTGPGTFEVGTEIMLAGEVSDCDGDVLSYVWREAGNVLCSGNVLASKGGTPVSVPDCMVSDLSVGHHTLTLQVSDETNEERSFDFQIEMIDTLAPVIMPEVNQGIPWPPDHKMVDIVVQTNAYDNSGLPVTLSAFVSSDEPEEGLGDGDMAPDWIEPWCDDSTGVVSLELRRERSGLGDGREYTLSITASDQYGNSSSTDVKILVPHDRRKK